MTMQRTRIHSNNDTVPSASPPVDLVAAVTPVYTSSGLFRQSTLIFIEHSGERYVLRITKQRKLILTK
jgi:hemin uptake protein HemP